MLSAHVCEERKESTPHCKGQETPVPQKHMIVCNNYIRICRHVDVKVDTHSIGTERERKDNEALTQAGRQPGEFFLLFPVISKCKEHGYSLPLVSYLKGKSMAFSLVLFCCSNGKSMTSLVFFSVV